MTDKWQTIDSAPRDGTVFIGVSLEPDREWPERRLKWGNSTSFKYHPFD